MTVTKRVGNYFKTFPKQFKKCWPLHLCVLLPILMILLFSYVPMTGIALAFKRYIATKGIFGSPSVGWQNFSDLFSLPLFWPAVWNTFKISILKIVISFPVPIIVALMLNEVKQLRVKKIIQTVVYLPYFLSWAVLGGIFLDIFSLDGAVNAIFNAIGIPDVYWLGESASFITMLVITEIWKNFGYGTVIFLSALTGIDPSLYEAAEVDGAGRWKQTLHVTLPGIMPMAVLLAVLNLGNVLNAGFDQIFMLMNNLVREDAEIIDTLIYDITFTNRNYGLATAAGLFKSLIAMVFVLTGWFLAHKYSDYKIF